MISGVRALLLPAEEDPAVDSPTVEPVQPDEIPEPQRSLLVHERDMTGTLEDFRGGAPHLRMIRVQRTGDWLHRRVVLMVGDEPVEFGSIRIHVSLFQGQALSDVLEGRLPLGGILRTHSIPHVCRPQNYFRRRSDALTEEAFALGRDAVLYGRFASLQRPDGEILAEVVEILPPFEAAPPNEPEGSHA
jgi:chorismate-pyruvate lyase